MTGLAPVETLLLPFYKTAAPAVDILKYKGYIVESINGRSPWDQAESLGGGSNAFLTPLTFNGSFILDPGTLSAGSAFSDPYFNTDVTYKLKDPVSSSTVDLSIPWAAVSSDDSFGNDEFSYTFDFLLPECLNVSSATIRSPATARFGDGQHQSKLFRRSDTSPHKLSVRQADALLPRPDPGLLAQMVSVPKEGSRAFAVDTSTAALIFQSNTIYESVDFAEIYPSLINDIDAALAKVRLANPSIKNLIIDVSTSAWNCDHHLLLQYLFSTDYKHLEYNFRLTSPAAKLLSASSRPDFPSNERYFNLNRLKPVEAGTGSILDNPVNISFGDASQPFSRKFVRTECQDMGRYLPKTPLVPKGTFLPANVIILSDGFCTYGCDEFMKIAREQLKIKTAVYGSSTNVSPSSNRFLRGNARSILRNAITTSAVNISASELNDWSRKINVVVSPYNTFDAGDVGTPIPLSTVEPKVADLFVKGKTMSADWPLGVWKAVVEDFFFPSLDLLTFQLLS
ncbi:hypothetical protein HDU67_001531 [Dinochytrium kinnereticum]|nr:hypothetical protein HDU67_001531 [Dinochytrium kinnereticum]